VCFSRKIRVFTETAKNRLVSGKQKQFFCEVGSYSPIVQQPLRKPYVNNVKDSLMMVLVWCAETCCRIDSVWIIRLVLTKSVLQTDYHTSYDDYNIKRGVTCFWFSSR